VWNRLWSNTVSGPPIDWTYVININNHKKKGCDNLLQKLTEPKLHCGYNNVFGQSGRRCLQYRNTIFSWHLILSIKLKYIVRRSRFGVSILPVWWWILISSCWPAKSIGSYARCWRTVRWRFPSAGNWPRRLPDQIGCTLFRRPTPLCSTTRAAWKDLYSIFINYLKY